MERYNKHKTESKDVQQTIPGPDDIVWRYADEYDQAIAKRDEELIEIKRRLLFNKLEGYRRFLGTNGPTPGKTREGWTPLQCTIDYASRYAETCLESGNYSSSETVETIIKEMVEENRSLPRGVAEWVVNQVEQVDDEE